MNKTDLKLKTKEELLKLAQRLGLRGISTLNKPELIQTIRNAQARRVTGIKKKAALVQKAADVIKRRAVRKRPGDATRSEAKPLVLTRKPKRTTTPKIRSAAAATEVVAHKFEVTSKKLQNRQVFEKEDLGELPDSYGTGRLYLAARDPHWLFAYWDLTGTQMAEYRKRSSDSRVVLRLYERGHAEPIEELTLQHDSRNWYIPVNKSATSYSAELGYWRHDGHFHNISRSREATTPPDHASSDTTARFVTIPIDLNFAQLQDLIRAHLEGGEQLAEILQRMQSGGATFPFRVDVNIGPWTEEQSKQLEQLVEGDILKRTQIGSAELSEWLRRRLQEETSSGLYSAFRPGGGESSPVKPMPSGTTSSTSRDTARAKGPGSRKTTVAK